MSNGNNDEGIELGEMENESMSVEGDIRLHLIVCHFEKLDEIVQLIRDEPHLLLERDEEGGTPLHVLSRIDILVMATSSAQNAGEIAKVLLGVGPDGSAGRAHLLNEEDGINDTPLLHASRECFPELVKVFLECDPQIITSENMFGDTCLHLAAGVTIEAWIKGALECARLILQYDRSLINKKNKSEETPLNCAVKAEAVDMVNLLLLYKLDFQQHVNSKGQGILHYLCLNCGDQNGTKIARLLLGVPPDAHFERKELLDLRDSMGYTPLLYASRNWFPALTRLFLECGADSKSQNNGGNTCLHFAALGDNEKALECARLILDCDLMPLNMENESKEKPFHYAIKKEAVPMVKLLLEPSYNLNLQNHVNWSRGSILHYLCLERAHWFGETDRTLENLNAILKSCSSALLWEVDDDGQTVLHWAADFGLPKITQILVADPRVNLGSLDNRHMTALHHAVINAHNSNGYKCVEHLIDRKFDRGHLTIQYLYGINGPGRDSPFQVACNNAPVPIVEKFLQALPEPQFWMSENNMTLVYEKRLLAIKVLMDNAFRFEDRDSDPEEILADFGPITGYVDPVKDMKIPQKETKYLENVLRADYRTQKEILMHPLTQLFIVKKGQLLQGIMKTWILFKFLWLLTFTLLVWTAYCNDEDKIVSWTTALVCAVIMVVGILILSIKEIFEMFSVPFLYIRGLSNWFQLLQIVLAGFAIIPVFRPEEVITVVNRNCAGVGILLAWILSMRYIGKLHEEIGLVVEVLKQVVIQILKILLSCSAILIAFMLAFRVLFKQDKSFNTTFSRQIVKVLVMMTGEYDFNAMSKFGEGGAGGANGNSANSDNNPIPLFVFLAFLVIIPISFFNLLTAFALEKVKEYREKGKVLRTAKQLEDIHLVESIILRVATLIKRRNYETFVRLLRKFNVTGTIQVINSEPKFQTVLTEDIGEKEEEKTSKYGIRELWNYISSIFCTELSPELRNQMINLAAQKSHQRNK